MVLNILKDFLIAFFIVVSISVIFKERKTRLGVIVKEGVKEHTNGKQGLLTKIGRAFNSDVRLTENSVSRLQATLSFDSRKNTFDLTEYGASKGNCTNGYYIANHQLTFSLPNEPRCFSFGFAPAIIAFVFVALQGICAYGNWKEPIAVLPYVMLSIMVIITYFMRADNQPIVESIFAILLTFYVDSVMYPTRNGEETLEECLTSAVLGVGIYIACFFAMRFFLSLKLDTSTIHKTLRYVAVAAIIGLILVNIVFASEINGAYNWISIAGVSFQPSEIVKVLLAFVLIVPIGCNFYSLRNLIIEIGTPIMCIFYALVIKDVGVLLQFGVLFVVAVLLQNSNILHSVLLIVTGIFGCKLVLRVSSTAAYRFESWLGEGNTLFESLTAKEIFANPYDYGYQSIHSLVAAFKNGALFGNDSFDVMSGITASNSDLVMSIIGQKYGAIMIYLIIGLFFVLTLNMFLVKRQQNSLQQVFSLLALALMCFTMTLNLCGTFGIIPLTGVVFPGVSDGMSAAFSYGCLFGVISSSGMNRKYLKTIKEGVKNVYH